MSQACSSLVLVVEGGLRALDQASGVQLKRTEKSNLRVFLGKLSAVWLKAFLVMIIFYLELLVGIEASLYES